MRYPEGRWTASHASIRSTPATRPVTSSNIGPETTAGGAGAVVSVKEEGASHRIVFEAPEPLARFIASKGSICIDGVSLTVNEVDGRRFGVNIIPHTQAVTTLGAAQPGARLNMEIDTLARYVARLSEFK